MIRESDELIRADVIAAVREPTYEVIVSRPRGLNARRTYWPALRLRPPTEHVRFERRSDPVILERWA